MKERPGHRMPGRARQSLPHCAAARDHVNVHSQSCCQGPGWCSPSLLQMRTELMPSIHVVSVIRVTTEGCVEVHGPCYH